VASPAGWTFFPYLVARGRGKLAATWFTSTSPTHEDLQWYAARIDVGRGDPAPVVIGSAPQSLEGLAGPNALSDLGGEYLAAVILRDGGMGVVSPIQNRPAHRFGFTWWRFDSNEQVPISK